MGSPPHSWALRVTNKSRLGSRARKPCGKAPRSKRYTVTAPASPAVGPPVTQPSKKRIFSELRRTAVRALRRVGLCGCPHGRP